MRAACNDCDREYGSEHGFPDLIIPLDVWRRVSPSGDEGGLLCPSCICKRLHDAGIVCEGAFISGPIETVSRPTMLALRRIENIELKSVRRENDQVHKDCGCVFCDLELTPEHRDGALMHHVRVSKRLQKSAPNLTWVPCTKTLTD